jgi:tetratricopeptide (TPR) repeat protein
LSLNHGLRTWAGLVLAVIATTLLIALALGGMCTLPDHVRLNAKGREAYDEGDYPSALQWAAGALAASHGDRDGEALADALKLRGDVLAARGDLEKAIEVYRQTLPHWKAFGHREGYSAVLESLGVAEARLGLIDQAEARFKEALETAQGLPPEIHHAGKLRGLGSIAALRGDTATANRWYAQASHLVASRPEEATHVGLKALRALTLSQDGRHAQALDDLYECLDYWQSKRHLRWMANTFLQMAVVLTAIGDTRQARAALERSRELYSQATDARGARLTAGWLQRPDLGAGDPAMLTEAFF